MKISFVVPSLEGGGAEKMMLQLSMAAVEAGHDVCLVLMKDEGAYLSLAPNTLKRNVLKKKSRVSGLIQVLFSKNGLRLLPQLLKLPRFLTLVPAMKSYLVSEQPDLVISVMHTCNLASIVARECCSIKTVILARECTTLSGFLETVPSRKKKLLPVLKKMYPLADKITVVSDAVGTDLVEITDIPTDKVATVYNPVITEGFIQKTQLAVDNQWLNNEQQFTLIAVGRLEKVKDYPTLIKAFALAVQQAPIKLLILGEGKEREELQQLIVHEGLEEHVTLQGFDPNPYKYLAKADLFILTSLVEGAGNVLIEAMACGCPVVSTASLGGTSELLGFGRYGKLTPPKDVGALSKLIVEAYSKRRISEGAKEYAMTFTAEHALTQYLELARSN